MKVHPLHRYYLEQAASAALLEQLLFNVFETLRGRPITRKSEQAYAERLEELLKEAGTP